MNIKDIISSNLITCDKDATLNDVSIKMKNYDIGFIPISDEKKIIGVITDRDIVVNALANNESENAKVIDYINKNIITVPYNSDIVDVLKVMSQNKIKRVLVESDKKIKGVISLSDIINSNYEEKVLIDTLKNIYAIKQKENNAEIDEFYL